ncbi:MAG TPA: methyltransferase domain-containing protein [Casimicrobiaceae bacterium]
MNRSTNEPSCAFRDNPLAELLRLDDEDFVRAAYQCLLGRLPAPAELPPWLARLREGGTAKIEILAAMSQSAEGRTHGASLPGLATASVASRARRVPIAGRLVRWLQQVLTLPDLAPRLSAQEAAFAAHRADAAAKIETALRETRERFAAMDVALAGASNELETKADRAQIEEIDERVRALAQFLSALRADLKKSDLHPLAGMDPARVGLPFDTYYGRFEDHFRGASDQIRERLAFYVPIVAAAAGASPARFADIGTGRGEMVELLREHGLDAYGVDQSEAMAARCRERGIPVVHADAIEHLASLEPGSIAGVTAIHVIEHLPFTALIALFGFAFRALRPGGLAIFETPNPENLIVGACNFYYDPTHLRPLPPEPMRFLLQSVGFERVAIERLHPGATAADVERASDSVAKLYASMMLVPQDYALIAYKPLATATAT